MKYLPLALAAILNATANLCIKMGMQGAPEGGGLVGQALAALRRPVLWAGLFCFGLSLVGYAAALRKLDISVAYPTMTGVGFAIVSLVAVFFLGEKLTGLRLGGICLIFLGIWLATR